MRGIYLNDHFYFNDHFADATAGTELAHRMARSHQNRELEETSDLPAARGRDQPGPRHLLDIMAALGVAYPAT